MTTDEYIEQVKKLSPPKFLNKVSEGIALAQKYHQDEIRFSGEPYVSHSLRVAITLGQMGLDTNTMIGGLLHNSVTNAPSKEKERYAEMQKLFGNDVAQLVKKYNNLSKATASIDTEYEIITKYILNSNYDLRPILIKLADNLDNVRTIEFMPKDRLSSKLKKILYIYGPLAEYLNLETIKKELEEKALEMYKPEEYRIIKSKMEEHHYTEEIKDKYIEYTKELLKDITPVPTITGRVKGIYSIYNKQKKQLKETGTININAIRDLIGLRVITDSVDNCFNVLEKIMDKGEIITQEFDDYISHPKPNGYSAMQGPIVLSEVSPNVIEIQIMTQDMYYYNTYGPASHIAYKESLSRYAKPTDKYNWVEQVHKEISKNIALRNTNISNPILVKIFPNNVYAFTPKGKIIQLDKGDTVVDFAYRIHTDIGNSMVSAKVNGKAVKLDYKIQTGDIVEIKTQAGKKTVKADWLKYANSQSTQSKMQKTWKNF